MVDGEHKFVMEYAADKIARAIGKTLVAPVITYVPEGSWENPGGHMGKPGTITLPEDRFVELLVAAGRSLKSGGFTTILFLGESGGNRTGMRTAAARLNELFKGAARAFWVDDYYTKSHADQNAYVTQDARHSRGSDRQSRQHPRHVRDAVRQRQARAHEEAGAWRRLREQRRERRSDQVDGGARQGVPSDQDRQRCRPGQGR